MKKSINRSKIGFSARLMAAIVMIALLASALTACSRNVLDGVESTADEIRVVGKVGDYEVCYDELYYLIMSCGTIMKNKYGDIWKDEASGAEYEEELRSMVLERITSNYAVLTLCEENGFKDPLSKGDAVDYVNDEINAVLYSFAIENDIEVTLGESLLGELTYTYEKGGEEKAREYFKAALKATYLTERVMRLTLGTEFAFENLVNILTGEKEEIIYSDEDIEDFMFSDDFICTRHVFIQNNKNDDREENRKLAESLIIEIPCLHAIVVDRVIFLELCPKVGGVQIARQIR